MVPNSPKPYAINYLSQNTLENNLSFVRELYRNILDRPGEREGIDYWTSLLNDNKITRNETIAAFFESPEAAGQSGNEGDVVAKAYRSLLLRDPDRAGLDFWTKILSSGTLDAGDLSISIINSREFLEIQDKQGVLPIVDVIWEDQASWDSVTAAQLARLIAYNPGQDGVTYPNKDLHFIVSGVGPKSNATLSASSHVYTDAKGVIQPAPTVIYQNNPEGFAQFIAAVSDAVYEMTNGTVLWATQDPKSTGSIGYHPDTTTYDYTTKTVGTETTVTARNLDYSHDWAGYQIPGGSQFASVENLQNAYMGFVDYTIYLNNTINGYQTSTGQKLRGLSELVYETEGTYPDMPTNNKTGSFPYPAVYPEWKDPQTALGGAPYQQYLFSMIIEYAKQNPLWNNANGKNGIILAATSAPIVNMAFWGAGKAYAQVYDLYGDSDDYIKTQWSAPKNLDPQENSPSEIASDFASFFANVKNPEGFSAKDQLYNVRYFLNDDASPANATNYNPLNTFIFSYGPGGYSSGNETANQPVFQYGTYTFSKDTPASLIANPAVSGVYYWNASDFAEFSSGFRTQLTTNLNQITQGVFSSSASPEIGVWGGERALDAWFGWVDLPSQPPAGWISNVHSISKGESIKLNDYIDSIYSDLVGRIPTTSEINSLTSIATSILNPATQDRVTLTAQAAIINHLAKSSLLDKKALEDASFINHLYSNILGRAPDASGETFYTGLLQSGLSRGALVESFIKSKEFESFTDFNLEYATFASLVNFLWQDEPESWTDPKIQKKVIGQLAELMQANPSFTLILDFNPEYSESVISSAGWNNGNLINFLQGLEDAQLTPTILFHPDGTSSDASQWFQNDGKPHVVLPKTVSYQMANWMASLNKAIIDSGLPSSYLLGGLVGEGSELPKDRSTYILFDSQYQDALNSLDLPSQNISLWATGDWHGNNTLADPSIKPQPPAVVDGYFVQLYDYWPQNTLLKSLPGYSSGHPLTDPTQATAIGSALLTSLFSDPQPINTQLLENPHGTILTLNFSGSSTGAKSDAPLFGQGSDVVAPWTINTTNQLLTALSTEAQALYQKYASGSFVPQIALWSIDQALDTLVPVSTIGGIAQNLKYQELS